MTYNKSAGSSTNNVARIGSLGVGVLASGSGTGSGLVASATGSWTIDDVYIDLNSGNSVATTLVTSVTLRGTGTNPFGEDNCT